MGWGVDDKVEIGLAFSSGDENGEDVLQKEWEGGEGREGKGREGGY